MRKFRGASFKRNEVELEAADPEVIPPPFSATELAQPTNLDVDQDRSSPLPAGAFGLPRPSCLTVIGTSPGGPYRGAVG